VALRREPRSAARVRPSDASKLLDTSAIIDGRIADVVTTGYLEGPLLVPRFVLRELQRLADGADPLRRNRGKRGFEILKRLQDLRSVEILDADVPGAVDVDAKLVEPALSRRRARATCAAGAATTMAATRGCRRKCRMVVTRTASRPRRRNCLGVRPPSRAPTPPAGISTATSRIASLVVAARPREDHAARRRLERARHHHRDLLAEQPTSLLDDDHRTVLEESHALPGLLALAPPLHAQALAREHDGLQR